MPKCKQCPAYIKSEAYKFVSVDKTIFEYFCEECGYFIKYTEEEMKNDNKNPIESLREKEDQAHAESLLGLDKACGQSIEVNVTGSVEFLQMEVDLKKAEGAIADLKDTLTRLSDAALVFIETYDPPITETTKELELSIDASFKALKRN